MDYDGLLENIRQKSKAQAKHRRCDIGLAVNHYMKTMTSRRAGRGHVAEAFIDLLPGALAENCRVEAIVSGVMRVRVSSGTFMFQMKASCPALLKELKKQCPGSGIREIKLVANR